MKKNETKNHKAIFMSLFLAFIMVTSVLGFIFGNNSAPGSQLYNGFRFTPSDSAWQVRVEGKKYSFSYLPDQLSSVNFSSEYTFANTIGFRTTYDENSDYAESISQSIYQLELAATQRTLFVERGFTSENSFNSSIIGCESATNLVPVLYYMFSNETKIIKKANCLILEGASESSFSILTEKVIYRLLGID